MMDQIYPPRPWFLVKSLKMFGDKKLQDKWQCFQHQFKWIMKDPGYIMNQLRYYLQFEDKEWHTSSPMIKRRAPCPFTSIYCQKLLAYRPLHPSWHKLIWRHRSIPRNTLCLWQASTRQLRTRYFHQVWFPFRGFAIFCNNVIWMWKDIASPFLTWLLLLEPYCTS